MGEHNLTELVKLINAAITSQRELLITNYRDSSGSKRDVVVQIRGADWYQTLIDETITWLQVVLATPEHEAWRLLGPDRAETRKALRRALDDLRGREKKASRWSPAVEGPAGDLLQRSETTPAGVVYLRNVERKDTELTPGNGSPAARIQRIWPMAKYNSMFKLEQGSYDSIQLI